jgi:hypothetical protein
VLLAICALAALIEAASVLDVTGMGGAPPWWGRLGAVIDASSKPYNLVARSVDPDGPAGHAGLRDGDLIDVRLLNLVERFSLSGFAQSLLNGRPITFSVPREAQQKEITVIPQPLPAQRSWEVWLGSLSSFWLLLFAAVIAWRRADVPQMRLLSLWLAVFVVLGGASGFASPWAWAYVLLSVSVSTLSGPLSLLLWVALAGSFAQPLSLPRRIAQWLFYTFLAIQTALLVAGTVGTITLQIDPLIANLAFVPFGGAVLMAVVCSALAIAASRGVERQRAAWTLVPIAAIFCSFIVAGIASSSLSYANNLIWGTVINLVIFAAPIALTYAALSRRLLDIGFVLNRALIFAIVSTIVIGAFVLVEWAASAWLVSASHTASTVIAMGVALGLGLSIRYIHKHVDRFVDRVFFRKRYEDEAALRRFAHESSYITDRSILLERAVREVKEHTNAGEATILVQDGATAYTSAEHDGTRSVGENDPAMVALRAWHKPVDLKSFEHSVLHGEFAYPMVSRGTLVGVLVCGTKRDGEVYAPDESEALFALAHGVGTALDVLSAQHDHSNGQVLRELAELRKDVKRLSRE